MQKNSLGERMKIFEVQDKLIRGIPVIMRLDGNSFHTYTKGFDRPFDEILNYAMVAGALNILKHAQGCKCAYIQSDEVSILFTDWTLNEDGTRNRDTEPWLDYRKDRINSISATYMVDGFHSLLTEANITKEPPKFDCRVNNYPDNEICNYFIWRQKDWERNSVSMLARSYYSHKQLYKKKRADMHEMLHEKGVNWANLEDKWKNGVFITKDKLIRKVKEGQSTVGDCPTGMNQKGSSAKRQDEYVERRYWKVHTECPIFVKNREVINNLLL